MRLLPRRDGGAVVELGSITVPSGILVIGDMGYLHMWSGRRPPDVPEDVEDPERRQVYLDAVDLRIVGSDATQAARIFNGAPQPYIYDRDEAAMRELFARKLGESGLDARLEKEPRGVAHRTRAVRAAADGGADFEVWGVWFVAIGGFPRAARFPVVGRRRDFGAVVGERWEAVEVRVSDRRVASRAEIGIVGVDNARLILADLDALEAWNHFDALDGLADTAFWGAGKQACAAALGAEELPEGVYGWENLEVEEALDRFDAVRAFAEETGERVKADFRPHSHHYQVMRQVRASSEEVGRLALGEADVLGFMTSWGDGVFPVQIDRAADGALVAVRIVLGDDDRRDRLAELIRG